MILLQVRQRNWGSVIIFVYRKMHPLPILPGSSFGGCLPTYNNKVSGAGAATTNGRRIKILMPLSVLRGDGREMSTLPHILLKYPILESWEMSMLRRGLQGRMQRFMNG